jgi:hypothetical protein
VQGYRTIIVNAVMTIAAGGTVQFTDLPPQAQHWLTIAVIAWSMLNVILRLLTKTPIAVKVADAVEKTTGLTPAQANEIYAEVSRRVAATVATMPPDRQRSILPGTVLGGIKPVLATAAQDIAKVAAALPAQESAVQQFTRDVVGLSAPPQDAAVMPPQNIAAPPPAQLQAAAPVPATAAAAAPAI